MTTSPGLPYYFRVQFQKVLTSNFVEITYTYVFWPADYEYHDETTRKFYYRPESALTLSTSRTIFSQTISRRPKMHMTKYVY